MIEMMEEEREEQQRAIDQIEDCFEETRPCPECSQNLSETCFRKHHLHWCTVHERMTDDNGVCSQSPPSSAPDNVMRCREVQADMTEEESYWAEVEENAVTGGVGFRESDEPHVH